MTTSHPLAATARLDDGALDLIFRNARTHNGWLDQPVPEALLREAVEIAKVGPTSVNISPMRIVFARSTQAKEKLKPALSPGNVDKTMSAPVTAIIGYDKEAFELLPKLFPHADARAWFAGNEAFATDTAYRNGTLQVAYLIIALRSLGLDTGPMTGFDADKVDAAFFAGSKVRSNVLVNIGYGDASKLFPRSPRLAFDEIARFA
jgi:3-hydroxypropanoate dehydrogenase